MDGGIPAACGSRGALCAGRDWCKLAGKAACNPELILLRLKAQTDCFTETSIILAGRGLNLHLCFRAPNLTCMKDVRIKASELLGNMDMSKGEQQIIKK